MEDVFSYGATHTQRNVFGVEVDALSGCGETLQDLIQVFSSAWKPESATLLNQQQNCLPECESQKVCPVLNVVWQLLPDGRPVCCVSFFVLFIFNLSSSRRLRKETTSCSSKHTDQTSQTG